MLDGEEIVATQRADLPRPDLKSACGVLHCGFDMPLAIADFATLSVIALDRPVDPSLRMLESRYDYDLAFDQRWRGDDRADAGLTWGVILEGDSFFGELEKHLERWQGINILEIGPGYGRLLQSLMRLHSAFGHYVGLDISPVKVEKLRRRFGSDLVSFEVGDCRTWRGNPVAPFDLIICSSTFEHVRPDFSHALKNLIMFLKRDGAFAFDLTDVGQELDFGGIGGSSREFVRHYYDQAIITLCMAIGLSSPAISRFSMRATDYAQRVAGVPPNDENLLTRDGVTFFQETTVAVHRRFVYVTRERERGGDSLGSY